MHGVSEGSLKVQHIFRGVAYACALLTLAVGCAAVLGWILNVPALMRIGLGPSFVSMKYNAAVGLILGGCTLLLRAPPPLTGRGRRVLGSAAAGLLVALGALTWLQDITHIDLGIDTLLFAAPPIRDTLHPGRMAPATSASLTALGLALLLLDKAFFRILVQTLVFAVGCVSLLALLCFVYSADALFKMVFFHAMAPSCSATLLFLAAGILFARPDRGPMAVVSSDTLGGVMARRTFPSVALVMIAFSFSRLAGERLGYYDMEFGLAIMVTACIVALSGIVWWGASALDFADRQRAENMVRLRRINRDLRMLSQCNQVLVRAETEGELFDKVCNIAVTTGEYLTAWIALKKEADSGELQRVAWCSQDSARSSVSILTPDESARCVRALSAGREIVTQRPAAPAGARRGGEDWSVPNGPAEIMLPLVFQAEGLGVMTILATDPQSFDPEEINLFQELTDDVAYGIHFLRLRELHRQAEQALRENSAWLDHLFEHAPDAIVVSDSEGRIVRVNPQAQRFFGYAAGELTGLPVESLLPERFADRHRHHRSRFYAHPQARSMGEGRDLFGRRKDGTEFPADITLGTMQRDGNVLTVCFVRDITERKRAEDALRERTEEVAAMKEQVWHAAKLAGIGELAASIAHELNNPLATINLRFESLSRRLADQPALHDPLTIIGEELDRMARLVGQLLQYSRRRTAQISSIDLRAEMDNALDLIHYQLRNRGIAVVRDFASNLPLTQADPQQIRQLFLNLLTNASDAMQQGGTLTLRIASVKLETGAAGVRVEIVDTGMGIAPEHLEKVWEPFFTTKPEGKGTGLGLAICRRIVHEHHGRMEIESQPGAGATVRITLPVNGKTNANG